MTEFMNIVNSQRNEFNIQHTEFEPQNQYELRKPSDDWNKNRDSATAIESCPFKSAESLKLEMGANLITDSDSKTV